MANVTLKGIKKQYNKEVVAVQDFNLEIEDKEFVVLVGPSGCGKSTTLRMIAGLEEITEGELYIGERLVNEVAPKDRDIAMVFQNYALYPHMSVFQNMGFALKLRKEKKNVIGEKVGDAAKILSIMDLLERKPKALSGGQRQRVAIGRAIVREPKVFLMDEPLSNLDAKLRNQMRAEIIKLRQRINTTFIYVTHDQIEAMTLGDRIVIMKDGFIQQVGTPTEVFETPANLFVAGFIGIPQMNFFDAELMVKNGNYEVKLEGREMTLPDDAQKILSKKNQKPCDVVLGVRPEHMCLADKDARDVADIIEAKVDVFEMMGSEVYLHVTIQDKDAIIRVPTEEIKDKFDLNNINEKPVYFDFPIRLMHIFDKKTQKNLLI
jgi:multiple sugar transport system ATP-binding protein